MAKKKSITYHSIVLQMRACTMSMVTGFAPPSQSAIGGIMG